MCRISGIIDIEGGLKNHKVHWSKIWALYVLNKFF